MLIIDSRTRRGEISARIGAHHVALAIDVLNSELRIDRCLVGIRRWARQIVVVETRKELILRL